MTIPRIPSSQKSPTQVILPLRMGNRGFQYNEHFGALQPIPITLGLPDFGKVIRNRLGYIRRHLVTELSKPMWISDVGGLTTTDDVLNGLEAICSLIEKNQGVAHAMEMLSNYVTREYLDIMINLFSAEPLFRHPLTGERISYSDRVTDGKFYSLFIYALMLRNNSELMEDDRSIPILDMFNNYSSEAWTRMVRWCVLQHLAEHADRFLTVGHVVRELGEAVGIGESSIRSALAAFARKKCIGVDTVRHIEAESTDTALADPNTRVVLSPRGQIHLELCQDLEYYEVLAIPRLYRKKRDFRSLPRTSMSERGSNVLELIKELQSEESVLVRDVARRSWARICVPALMKEYTRVFGQK